MKQRVLFLLKTYLWTMLVFIIAKVAFMLLTSPDPSCRRGDLLEGSCRRGDFCHNGLTVADVWQVIIHGLSLDLSTSLYILILPFLITIISIWWQHRMMATVLRVYFIIISLAMALAFVADTSLYPFWGFKLDASCLQYLETPTEAMASVSTGYMIMRLIALFLTATLIFGGYRLLVKCTMHRSSSARLLPKGRKNAPLELRSLATEGTQECTKKQIQCIWSANSVNLVSKFSEFAIYLLMIPVIIIGIRGGLDESTTNVGQVYYSQIQFLNHSAINPVFNFLASFEKTASNIVDYNYYDEAECTQLMEGLYPTESVATDTLLNTSRPNIVIVLMESAGSVFQHVMPCLAQLKDEGIDFTQCYANSWRTDRGTVCTYSGYPSFPTSSVMKMPKKTAHLSGIASVLQQQGYHTSYLYGGDINFTNMRSYLIATGWEQLTWKADYTQEEQNTAEWGVRDDITFNTLYDQITKMEPGRHYLMGFSTLSTHQPWDVPLKQYDDEIENAFYYLDHCIGDFIDRLKSTPQWKELLVVFLPDHSMDFRDIEETSQERNRIPMVWVGGAVKASHKIGKFCNQTDLVATLLAQMQLPHDAFPWSRDVLSQNYQYPFAVHNYNNGFSLVDSTGYMVYDLDSRQVIADKSTDTPRLERMGKAILQATTKDLRELRN